MKRLDVRTVGAYITLRFSKGCSDILMCSTLTKGKRVGVYSDPNLQMF
jgi:hypothetical protein